MRIMAPIPVGALLLWPVDTTRLWQSGVIRLSCICLVLASIALAIKYTQRRRARNSLALSPPDSKTLCGTEVSQTDILDYFPPPPGASPMSTPYAQDDLFCVLTSGHLAAKADREEELRSQVDAQAKPGAWRRQSNFAQKAAERPDIRDATTREDLGPDPPNSDQLQLFLDPDLNGVWRRRVLEFGSV